MVELEDISQKRERVNAVLLILGNVITRYGNMLLTYGLNLWIIEVSGNTKTLGIISSIGILPVILITIFGGIISDSFNKKYIVVLCDLVSGLTCFIMAIIINVDYIDVKSIVIFKIIINTIQSLFNPSIKALPAYAIYRKNRKTFNSISNIFAQMIQVLGPLITSFVIIKLKLNIKQILLIDSFTFICSAISETFILIEEQSKECNKKLNMLDRLKEGFLYLSKEKYLINVVFLASLSNIFIAGYNLYLPFYANYLEDERLYGYMLSIEAIGGILGALTLSLKKSRLGEIKISLNLFWSGVFFIPLLLVRNRYATCLAIFSFGLFLTRFNILFFTYLQNNIDKKFLGRVLSITTVAAIALMPIGQAFFGFIIDWINVFTLPLIGVFICVISITSYMISLKSNH